VEWGRELGVVMGWSFAMGWGMGFQAALGYMIGQPERVSVL